ncbi:MAG: glycosyltransferase [Winogradskyella sp.]|uniref:glycosyltransferase n=1 Tax=Winogradskyella sp. TaxID=1883156 RepID=UPI0017C81CB9|nr:glycosyltransferase [Winogradskyella sp.]
MPKTNKKKICIVVSSLGVGGAERSSAMLSQMLYDSGHDVYITTVKNIIDYPYKGELLNLGKLKKDNDSIIQRIKRLFVFRSYLKKHNFDFIIDGRSRVGFLKELIINRVLYKSKKTIFTVHSFNTDIYIHPNAFLAKIIYRSTARFVVVSEAIAKKIKATYGFKNVSVIHNSVDENLIKFDDDHTDQLEKYILFFGRLDDEVKNISLLLNGYAKSMLPDNSVKLKILGNGEDLEKLKAKSRNLTLTGNVEFLNFKSNPFSIVSNALFTVLTSRYEGFPMVIVESLNLGTPVVSVDCLSGPNEIIQHEYNGLLVENYNIDALASAMNRMYTDKDLYLHCKENAKVSVSEFSIDNIAQQWETILNKSENEYH